MDSDLWTNIRYICDQIVSWQAPSGGVSLETCPYHRDTPYGKPSAYGQDMPWLVRALYRAYDLLQDPKYKAAADRYAVYFLACMYEKASAFALGGALDPCFTLYREHNLLDDSLDHKAKSIYRWLLGYRTENPNYINAGYGFHDEHGVMCEERDVGFSNDLSDVGRGLVGYAGFFHEPEALDHAVGLARYFLREHRRDTIEGVWSSRLGTWLIGPWHISGFENVPVYADEIGWGWSAYYASHYLIRLHDAITDEGLKTEIRERCVASLRWTFDTCQFDDGALGMAGRDDKWLGMTALAIMQYVELSRRAMIDPATHAEYYPRALKALAWLRRMSSPETFPPDNYVPVTRRSRPWPGWNTSWMIALTAEGLMSAPALLSLGHV